MDTRTDLRLVEIWQRTAAAGLDANNFVVSKLLSKYRVKRHAIDECTALDSDEENVPSELEASKPFIPIDAPMQRLKQRRPAHR